MTVAFDPAWARSSFIPIVDNTYDLGAAALQFRNLYLGTGIISSGAIKVSPSSSETWLFESTGIRTNVAAFTFRTNTAEGSDTHSLILCGGGSSLTSRGASVQISGNEAAGQRGYFIMDAGNATGASIYLRLNESAGVISFRTGSGYLWNLDYTGNWKYNQASNITASTSDAADNSELILTGGGAAVSTGNFSRGAQINLAGNEHATRPGEGYFEANSIIRIRVNTGGSVQLQGDTIAFRNNAGTNVWGISSGDMLFYQTTNTIRASTSDASDTASLFLCGGGSYSTTRGAIIELYGNENGVPGALKLTSGNVANSYIQFSTSIANAPIISKVNATEIYRTTATAIQFALANALICTNTSDGSDNSILTLSGGGDAGSARGAFVAMYGNENASPGYLVLSAGNVTGGTINFNTSALTRWTLNTSGQLTSDSTNGGGIILARTGVNLTPILSGASTLDADVTNLTSIHYGLAIVQSATVSPSTVFIANGADSNGSQMMFFKTRATAPGTDANTIVASGDQISTFLFGGADGSAYKYAAQITAGIDGTPGANDMPGYLLFRVTADGAASPSDALKIGNDRVLTINNCVAAPSGTPTTSGYLYVESGALKYKGSSGTVTTVANA